MKYPQGLLANMLYHLYDDGIQKIISEYELNDWQIMLNESTDSVEKEIIQKIIDLWPQVQKCDDLITQLGDIYDEE